MVRKSASLFSFPRSAWERLPDALRPIAPPERHCIERGAFSIHPHAERGNEENRESTTFQPDSVAA